MFRRQRELEQRLVEEQSAARIEALVQKRVEEELARRKDEIEAEVNRRVQEATAAMEAQLMAELERRRQEQIELEKQREVGDIYFILHQSTVYRCVYMLLGHISVERLAGGALTLEILYVPKAYRSNNIDLMECFNCNL